MGHSAWDKYLREILGQFKSEEPTPPWESFEQDLNPVVDPVKEVDPFREDGLRDALSNFKPNSQVEGWERIQASLDAADKEFDEKVKKRIHQYEPHFDPLSWPAFLKKLSDSRLLRIKLIALKVVEFAAILLILLTVVNIGRMGKIPFDTPLYENPEQIPTQDNTPVDKAYVPAENSETNSFAAAEASEVRNNSTSPANNTALSNSQPSDINNSSFQITTPSSSARLNHSGPAFIHETNQARIQPIQSIPIASNLEPKSATGLLSAHESVEEWKQTEINDQDDLEIHHAVNDLADIYITEAITSLEPAMAYNENKIPTAAYIVPLSRTFLEFGILTQLDYNMLRMPEDRLYSAGKQIVFPQQGIPSHGFGAGFTLAIGHPLWALETGIIYSAKEFKPGRQLVVGGAFDNGSVEFEAMRLQLVSVPFQYRYRFEPKGRLKAYALAGFGLHVIAESNIDVLIKYHFPSLSFGEDPNNTPGLAETIRESRRVREHIRDGAPFSTKSFTSLHVGLGLEYTLTQQKTLFFQPAFQYQIPNLKFSNNNGKHIRSVSLQVGVRTPLGT